jgi:hypothetical protein
MCHQVASQIVMSRVCARCVRAHHSPSFQETPDSMCVPFFTYTHTYTYTCIPGERDTHTNAQMFDKYTFVRRLVVGCTYVYVYVCGLHMNMMFFVNKYLFRRRRNLLNICIETGKTTQVCARTFVHTSTENACLCCAYMLSK